MNLNSGQIKKQVICLLAKRQLTMVHCYGTASSETRSAPVAVPDVKKQIALSLAIIAAALVLSCALISSARMSEKTVLFGLGSGEEQEGANAMHTTFATFEPEADYITETLGPEYYKEVFEEVLAKDSYLANVDEVKVAVDEAKAEHDTLKKFAEGADATEFGGPPS